MAQRVLIIENDRDIRDIVCMVLEAEGYEILTLDTTLPLNFIDYNADLILLDEWYNEKEGPMLCHEIKSIHQMQHTPIIIFSTSVKIEEIAKSCKADGFVRKPFDIVDLLSEIEKCMPADSGLSRQAI
jgi:DNA-binding response OmpR family regulator